MARRALRAIGCPTRCARSCRCCSTSPTRTRSNGRRSPPRATARRTTPLALLAAMRRDSVVARLPLQRVSRARRSRRARRSPPTARCPTLPELPARRGARVLDRRRDDDRDRRRVLGARRCRTATARSASTSPRPRSSIARGSPLDAIARARLSTVYMPGRKITMLPETVVEAFTLAEGRARARAVALRGGDAGRPRSFGTRRASSACRSPPTCASTRSARRSPATAARRPSRRGPRSCARCGNSRRRCRASAASPISRASTTASTSTGTTQRDGEAGRVRIVPRPRGEPARQARLGADDLRQQHLGQAARRRRRRRDSIARSRTARSR